MVAILPRYASMATMLAFEGRDGASRVASSA
jgi:hypothetical protein